MADPKDDDPTAAQPSMTSEDGGNGAPATGVSVNWRGIVDDDTPQPKSIRFFQWVGHVIVAVLIGLGLKRKRRADGALEPRPWGRVIVIWGGAIFLIVVFSAGHIVGAGNVGVPVTLGSAGEPVDPGLHFTAPWPLTRVVQMSTRTQNYTMSAARGEGDVGGADDSILVLGRDGGQANVDATVLYRVRKEDATDVYENVGTNFQSAIIRPSARSCIREVFTTRDVVDASTEAWPEISEAISACMQEKIEPRGITLEDFQLRDVRLSPQVQQAVEVKIAADTTGDVQLTPEYLQFAYIQALRAFAASPNNTTLVVPGGDAGGLQLDLPVAPSSSTP
jgi:regulator of protease activity HflC (stomatin/prohibitin superfamily)